MTLNSRFIIILAKAGVKIQYQLFCGHTRVLNSLDLVAYRKMSAVKHRKGLVNDGVLPPRSIKLARSPKVYQVLSNLLSEAQVVRLDLSLVDPLKIYRWKVFSLLLLVNEVAHTYCWRLMSWT